MLPTLRSVIAKSQYNNHNSSSTLWYVYVNRVFFSIVPPRYDRNPGFDNRKKHAVHGFTRTYHNFQNCSTFTPGITGPNLGIPFILHASQIHRILEAVICLPVYRITGFQDYRITGLQDLFVAVHNLGRMRNED